MKSGPVGRQQDIISKEEDADNDGINVASNSGVSDDGDEIVDVDNEEYSRTNSSLANAVADSEGETIVTVPRDNTNCVPVDEKDDSEKDAVDFSFQEGGKKFFPRTFIEGFAHIHDGPIERDLLPIVEVINDRADCPGASGGADFALICKLKLTNIHLVSLFHDEYQVKKTKEEGSSSNGSVVVRVSNVSKLVFDQREKSANQELRRNVPVN